MYEQVAMTHCYDDDIWQSVPDPGSNTGWFLLTIIYWKICCGTKITPLGHL